VIQARTKTVHSTVVEGAVFLFQADPTLGSVVLLSSKTKTRLESEYQRWSEGSNYKFWLCGACDVDFPATTIVMADLGSSHTLACFLDVLHVA